MENQDLVQICTLVAAKITEQMERHHTVMPTLTLEETAKALGVSTETARKLCAEGKIAHIKMDRLYRIKPADVNAYLEANYTGGRR